MVPLSDDPVLVWNYTVIAAILFIGTCGFWLTFRGLDKEEVAEWRQKGEKEVARAAAEPIMLPVAALKVGDPEK